MKIYLVGGSIRDRLLGKKSKDRDFVVFDATENEFLNRFPRAKKVGKKISVYLIGRDEYTISKYQNIMDDLMSRDLTINAIAEDDKGRIYHHPLAIEDLKNRVLRAISRKNFEEDPLRVHRMARFYAQFPDFSVDINSLEIIRQVGGNIHLMKKISKERVSQEVSKAICAKKPSNFFSLLIETGATGYWFSELEQLKRSNRWKGILDACNMNEICAWMSLGYGFIENFDEINSAKVAFRNMSNRIGMPKKITAAGISFVANYLAAKEIFFKSPEVIRDLLYIMDRQKIVEPFFYVMEKITQKIYLDKVTMLLNTIKSTKLPNKYKGLGPESGEILRNMQIREIEKCLCL